MPFTVYYHTKCEGFYGRAWVATAMLKHTDTEFDNKGPEEAPAGVGFAPPMVGFPEGHTVAQTTAISGALGKAVCLAPTSPAGDAKAQQLMFDGIDISTEMDAGKPVERIATWLAHFETVLGDNDFFVDNTLSYADFHLYPIFMESHWAAKQAKGKYEGYEMGPKLTAWRNRMSTLPAHIEMSGSGIPYLPEKYI